MTAARRRFEACFTAERMADGYEAIYRTMVERSGYDGPPRPKSEVPAR